jgi:hypothetical protein
MLISSPPALSRKIVTPLRPGPMISSSTSRVADRVQAAGWLVEE